MCERGPIVYCLEGMDVEGGKSIDDVLIPADIKLEPKKAKIAGYPMVALEGTAKLTDQLSWQNTLYRPVSTKQENVKIRLIPYYAWGNRGKMDMTVWMRFAP